MTRDPNCIFCKIVAREIPSPLLDESEHYVAFADINPQAPTHILVVPTDHKRDVRHYDDANELGEIFKAAARVAEKVGLANGFRLVVNTGDDGGQTVHHLHVHLLGGRQMNWPPG